MLRTLRYSSLALLCCTCMQFHTGAQDSAPTKELAPKLQDNPDPNKLSTSAATGKPQSKPPQVKLPPKEIYLRLPTYPVNIRQPMGVHVYYPPQKELLLRQLASLDTAQALPPVPGVAKVYLAPWGAINGALPTAAKVYRHIRDNGGARTIILVSRPHCTEMKVPASVWPNGAYATPIGISKINALAAMTLLKKPEFYFDANIHGREASIETNVLLIQHFLPEASIVPVLISPKSKEQEVAIAEALAKAARAPGVVLVAVSNLSYAVTSREQAGELDLKTISALNTLDLNIINNTGMKRDKTMPHNSGVLDSPKVVMAGIIAALELEMDTVTWLGHAAVRQIPHAPLVTGCAAAAISERSAAKEPELINKGLPQSNLLSQAAQVELGRIARDSLEAAAVHARYDTPYPQCPELLKKRGLFMTVLDKDGNELASMGFLGPKNRLCVAASEAARMCATGEDPQMPKRLTPEQARNSTIMISILKNFRTAGSWQDVKNGNGVVVVRGTNRCTVLPSTARRHHWSVEDMLSFACKRAGLRPDAYRLPNVDIFTFKTDIYTFEPESSKQ